MLGPIPVLHSALPISVPCSYFVTDIYFLTLSGCAVPVYKAVSVYKAFSVRRGNSLVSNREETALRASVGGDPFGVSPQEGMRTFRTEVQG